MYFLFKRTTLQVFVTYRHSSWTQSARTQVEWFEIQGREMYE